MHAHVHGRSLTEPFAYETYRQQRIAKKMEEERQSRISMVKKLPKVRCAAWDHPHEADAPHPLAASIQCHLG